MGKIASTEGSVKEYYNIRLSTKKKTRPIEKYMVELEAEGFIYNQRETWYSSFCENKCVPEEEIDTWKAYAKRKGLKITYVPERYTRNNDYRSTYFKTYKPAVTAKYRCAYCGYKFERKDISVDHIFPINKLMYQQTARDAAKFCGINGANEAKNLVAACKRCNSRKGTKMGLWVLRGFIGRSETFWKIRYAIRIVLVWLVFYVCFLFLEQIHLIPYMNPFN